MCVGVVVPCPCGAWRRHRHIPYSSTCFTTRGTVGNRRFCPLGEMRAVKNVRQTVVRHQSCTSRRHVKLRNSTICISSPNVTGARIRVSPVTCNCMHRTRPTPVSRIRVSKETTSQSHPTLAASNPMVQLSFVVLDTDHCGISLGIDINANICHCKLQSLPMSNTRRPTRYTCVS